MVENIKNVQQAAADEVRTNVDATEVDLLAERENRNYYTVANILWVLRVALWDSKWKIGRCKQVNSPQTYLRELSASRRRDFPRIIKASVAGQA